MRGKILVFVVFCWVQVTAAALPTAGLRPLPQDTSLKHSIAEGFFKETHTFNNTLLKVWNTTWLLAFGSPGQIYQRGTAFLVEAHPLRSDRVVLIFATNQHVLTPFCLVTGNCRGGLLYNDVAILRGPKRSSIRPEGPGFSAISFTVIYAHETADVALIATVLPEPEKYGLPRIYRAPFVDPSTQVHQKVYHFGYPGAPIESAPPPNNWASYLLQKRWSTGVLLDTRNQYGTIAAIATTADGYSGQSGGPIATENGIIGINHSILNDQRSWMRLRNGFDPTYWYTRYFQNTAELSNFFRELFGYIPGRTIPYMGREEGTDPRKYEPHFFGYPSTLLKTALSEIRLPTAEQLDSK